NMDNFKSTRMFIKMWQPQSNPHSNISYYCNELLTQFSLQTPCGLVKLHTPFCSDQPSADCLTTVGYKLFSNTPLWVLTEEPDRIPDAIRAFDVRKYLLSWEFE